MPLVAFQEFRLPHGTTVLALVVAFLALRKWQPLWRRDPIEGGGLKLKVCVYALQIATYNRKMYLFS